MSFDAMDGKHYVYKLKDDLEAFIYIVLYSALRWLPLASEHPLKWWLTRFFTTGSTPSVSGVVCKELNAIDRRFTKGLESKRSVNVLEWLREAMNLHYKDTAPNPLWDDGRALGDMWRRKLEGDIPDKDRLEHKASALGVEFEDEQPLHATFTARPSIVLRKNGRRSARPPTSAKRQHASCDGASEDSLSKRLKPNGNGTPDDLCWRLPRDT